MSEEIISHSENSSSTGLPAIDNKFLIHVTCEILILIITGVWMNNKINCLQTKVAQQEKLIVELQKTQREHSFLLSQMVPLFTRPTTVNQQPRCSSTASVEEQDVYPPTPPKQPSPPPQEKDIDNVLEKLMTDTDDEES